MNPLIRKYKYTIDWINSKGEMVQNIIDAKSMQEAMKKLQILRGKKFSKSGNSRWLIDYYKYIFSKSERMN